MTDCLLKLCAHRALDGAKCHGPALRQSDYCRHHARFHPRPIIFPAYIYQANTIPDLIQAMRRTVHDVQAGHIKFRLAGQILNEINKRMRAVDPSRHSPALTQSLPKAPLHEYQEKNPRESAPSSLSAWNDL